MREIDSIHDNSEARLRRALQSLSASSATDAPPEIGDALTRAFRRYHARRRAVRQTAITAAVFAVLLPAVVLLVRPHPVQPRVARAPETSAFTPPTRPAPGPVVMASNSQPPVKSVRTRHVRQRPSGPFDDFVALPSSEQALRGEDLRVVRLELTGRALRIVGAPVSEEIADRRLLADFVVGQDGTPYAVRLVR